MPMGAPENERASSHPALRIAIYTHDTFGLGHVRRCTQITHALARAAPDATVQAPKTTSR